MPKSLSKPASLALPIFVRSRKDSKYKSARNGIKCKSIFRSNRFVLFGSKPSVVASMLRGRAVRTLILQPDE